MPAGSLWLLVVLLAGQWSVVSAFAQTTSTAAAAADEPALASEPPPADSAPPPQPPAVPAPASPVAPLDTIYLRDSQGKLVPVIGMTYEEFDRLLRLDRGLAPPPPPGYVIARLAMDGEATERVATFQVTLAIQVRVDGWVAVPIRLAQAVLGASQKYQGPGEYLLTASAAEGGYICWLKGNDRRPHEVTFDVTLPLEKLEEQWQLAAALPVATESVCSLKVPHAVASAKLLSGEGIASFARPSESATQITVLGAAGDLKLVWRESLVKTSQEETRLDVSGNIAVRIESEQRVTSDARLRVRTLGQSLESFVVRLPPGMEFVPLAPATEYRVTPLDQDRSLSSPEFERVLVQLAQPTTSAVEVAVRCSREPGSQRAAVNPIDFVVEGALRQRGTVDFLTDGDWQLTWTQEDAVHRMDVPAETTNRQLVAKFEYFQQPSQLSLLIEARPARVSVEPTHMAFVDTSQVRLETLLKLRFRGARATGLRLQLADWKLDRVTPEALFEPPVIDEQGQTLVPFTSSGHIPAELDVKLELHRPLAGDEGQVAFNLPLCLANNIAPATTLIFAADNLELTPNVESMVGLSPEPTSVRLPGRQQAPLVYRDPGGGETARFATTVRQLKRLTTVAGAAQVRIDEQQIQVVQRLDYRIAHEPQRVFTLVAPSEIVAAGNLHVSLGEEQLEVLPQSTIEPGQSSTLLSVTTQANQIGAFQFTVNYSLPLHWDRRAALPLEIPLVVPATEQADEFSNQRIDFSLADRLQIEPDVEETAAEDLPEPQSGSSLAFSWSHPLTSTKWILELAAGSDVSGIAVSQMWVQTWLSPGVRQERTALRLVAERDALVLKVDKSVKQSSVVTAVDGREVPHSFRQPGILLVTLPAAARGRECLLEASYTVDAPPQWLGILSHEWRLAQIEDAQPPRRVYWQLVLPGDQHLLVGPPDLASEMVWSGRRSFARPRAVFDQRQLEAWIKATPQEMLPRSANEYLFGAVSRWPTPRFTVIDRIPLVLTASSVVLAAALLLLHVPRLRRADLAVVAATVQFGAAWLAPELTLLAVQASVLGIVIAVGAALWNWVTTKPRVLSVTANYTPARVRDSRSTRPPLRPDRSSKVTTTVPGHAAVVEARP